jgi:thioredoxin 1
LRLIPAPLEKQGATVSAHLGYWPNTLPLFSEWFGWQACEITTSNIDAGFKWLKVYFDIYQYSVSDRQGKFMNRNGAGIGLGKILLLFVAVVLASGVAWAEDFNNLPVKGKVAMIDLGATECIPCKMMAPIMEKMEKQYAGKAAIVFIDVWKHKEQARRFGIRAIPTQIFFHENGKEVFRHVGFMSEKAIVNQLKKMGVE